MNVSTKEEQLGFLKNLLDSSIKKLEQSKELEIPILFKWDLEAYYVKEISKLKTKINQLNQSISKL